MLRHPFSSTNLGINSNMLVHQVDDLSIFWVGVSIVQLLNPPGLGNLLRIFNNMFGLQTHPVSFKHDKYCFFSHCIIYFFICVSFFLAYLLHIFTYVFLIFSRAFPHFRFSRSFSPMSEFISVGFFSLNSIYSILFFAWFPIRAWVWQIPGFSGSRHQQVQTGWDFLCTPLWSGWELLGVVFRIGPRIRCLPQGSTVCHARFERQSTGTGEARTRRGPRSPWRPLHQLSNLNRRANVGNPARTWTDGGPLWNPTGLGCLCDRLDRVWPREDTDFVRALRKGHKFARFSWFKFKWNLKVLDFSVARFFCWMRFGGKIWKSLRNCDGPDEDHSAWVVLISPRS